MCVKSSSHFVSPTVWNSGAMPKGLILYSVQVRCNSFASVVWGLRSGVCRSVLVKVALKQLIFKMLPIVGSEIQL